MEDTNTAPTADETTTAPTDDENITVPTDDENITATTPNRDNGAMESTDSEAHKSFSPSPQRSPSISPFIKYCFERGLVNPSNPWPTMPISPYMTGSQGGNPSMGPAAASSSTSSQMVTTADTATSSQSDEGSGLDNGANMAASQGISPSHPQTTMPSTSSAAAPTAANASVSRPKLGAQEKHRVTVMILPEKKADRVAKFLQKRFPDLKAFHQTNRDIIVEGYQPPPLPGNRRVGLPQGKSADEDKPAAAMQEKRRRIVGYLPAPMYTPAGKLRLGQPDIPIYEDEEEEDGIIEAKNVGTSAASQYVMSGALPPPEQPRESPEQLHQEQTITYQLVENPPRSTIGRILDSASRYIPGLGRRENRGIITPIPITITTTPQHQQHSQQARTEPRPKTQAAITSKTPATAKQKRDSHIMRYREPFARTLPEDDGVRKSQQNPWRTPSEGTSTRESEATSTRESEATSTRESPPILLRQARRRAAAFQKKAEEQRADEAERAAEKQRAADAQAKRAAQDEAEIDFYAGQTVLVDQIIARRPESISPNQPNAVANAETSTEAAKTPAQERKRKRESPKEIPNPKGSSYGMDLDYFVVDDSTIIDSDGSEPPSPTPSDRPTKSRRLDSSNERPAPLKSALKKSTTVEPKPTNSNGVSTPSERNSPAYAPSVAQPYTGTIFNLKGKPFNAGNVFDQAAAVSTPRPKPPPLDVNGKPITNMSGHFCVPSPDLTMMMKTILS